MNHYYIVGQSINNCEDRDDGIAYLKDANQWTIDKIQAAVFYSLGKALIVASQQSYKGSTLWELNNKDRLLRGINYSSLSAWNQVTLIWEEKIPWLQALHSSLKKDEVTAEQVLKFLTSERRGFEIKPKDLLILSRLHMLMHKKFVKSTDDEKSEDNAIEES